jgi:hypothetical protein
MVLRYIVSTGHKYGEVKIGVRQVRLFTLIDLWV